MKDLYKQFWSLNFEVMICQNARYILGVDSKLTPAQNEKHDCNTSDSAEKW